MKSDKPEKKIVGVTAELSQLRGVYSNLANISHTNREFIFDFFLQLQDQGQLVSRIITNPPHAKAFLNALMKNVEKYESKFGVINDPSGPGANNK